MSLRIAVTGTTGFVGKCVLPLLLNAGHQVSALVRKPEGTLRPTAVRVVQGDLSDMSALADLTTGADVVIHLAGSVTGINAHDFMQTNLRGTLNLAQASVANNVKHFLQVSSLAAREPGLNAYSASKSEAEHALQRLASSLTITILRPAAIYGPGDKATLPLLQALMSRTSFIPGTPRLRFGMVHVDDVARALVSAIYEKPSGLFEIDDGAAAHSWPELLNVSRQNFGTPKRVIYIPKTVALIAGFLGDGVARLRHRPSLVNSGQIRQIYHPDWSVKGNRWPLVDAVQLSDGLPRTIRWYQSQGLLPQHGAADRSAPHSGTTE